MNILFLGGKNIGHAICQQLLEGNLSFQCVINPYEVEGEWYLTPRSLPIDEIPFSIAKRGDWDLIIVAFYDKILKEPFISKPRLGAFNLHLGNPGRYRGAYPNVWALMNGDQNYKVVIHAIDEGIDTGDIVSERSFPIRSDWDGRQLYLEMVRQGSLLFADTLPSLLDGTYASRPQKQNLGQTHFRYELSHDIHAPQWLKDKVRALTFPPFKPPFMMIGDRKFEIKEVSHANGLS